MGLAQNLSEQAVGFTKRTGYAGQSLRSELFAAGFLRSTERNWQDARTSLQHFWTELNNPFYAYDSYSELALLAGDADKWHVARIFWREALRMVVRTPDRLYQARTHYRLADAANKAGDAHEAESEFIIAREQLNDLPDSDTIRVSKAVTELGLAFIEMQNGQLEAAARRLDKAGHLVNSARRTWLELNYHQALGELHFRRANWEESDRALWNAIRVAEIHLGSLETDADRLAWERDAGRAYRTLVEIHARQPGASIRAWELWEWYRASAVRVPPLSPEVDVDLSQRHAALFGSRMRRALRTLVDQTVISFAYLPSGIAAWAFDNRGVDFAWIPASEQEVVSRVRSFSQLCADPSSSEARLRQEAAKLYEWLLAPFDRKLEPGRLLIVEPDAVLSEVAWPALVDSRGEYLGSRFAIVVSPGLGYWLNLREPTAISRETRILVVGMPALNPKVAARFAPLPDADREAQSIAATFRNRRLLSGREVTLPAIQLEISRSAVFHFAGHAVAGVRSGLVLASPRDENSAFSDLLTEEPTLLTAVELGAVAMQRLQLVVLSACSTAETEKGFGAPDTLVRIFLRARVPHVVASRWPVDSRATREAMAEFYRQLFEGQPAAKALHRAAEALRAQPATAHPYFWSAFATYGR